MRFSMSGFPSGRALLRAAALAVVLVLTTACGDDPFSPYWDRGTYYLRWANNREVPTTVSGGYSQTSAHTDVVRGHLTLRGDHSYQLVVDVREVMSGGQVYESSRVYAGHYENEGRTLYLDYYLPRDYYSSTIVANWRDGRVEMVVPDVAGGTLCVFE